MEVNSILPPFSRNNLYSFAISGSEILPRSPFQTALRAGFTFFSAAFCIMAVSSAPRLMPAVVISRMKLDNGKSTFSMVLVIARHLWNPAKYPAQPGRLDVPISFKFLANDSSLTRRYTFSPLTRRAITSGLLGQPDCLTSFVVASSTM